MFKALLRPFIQANNFKKIEKSAQEGDSFGQLKLAQMYHFGTYVDQDFREASYWYKLAAAQGESEAQSALGEMYEYGQGVVQDYRHAYEWYEKAAVQGNAYAQNSLGWLHEHGLGADKSYVKAYEWYEKAALQLLAEAQYNLGKLCYRGLGTAQNYASALRWFENAVQHEYLPAYVSAGMSYANGLGCPKDANKAKVLFEKAALGGMRDAQVYLANCYEEENQSSKALEWYIAAAKQGEVSALTKLGIKYLFGQGVQRNEQIAYCLLESASDGINDEADDVRAVVTKMLSLDKMAQAKELLKNPQELWGMIDTKI
jgi:hypothetical protein